MRARYSRACTYDHRRQKFKARSPNVFWQDADGTPVDIYTLKSDALEARIITYGGIVHSAESARQERQRRRCRSRLRHARRIRQWQQEPYFGALIGRYGNRIAAANFNWMARLFNYAVERRPRPGHPVNTLHGGPKGFDKVVWTGKTIPHGVELT